MAQSRVSENKTRRPSFSDHWWVDFISAPSQPNGKTPAACEEELADLSVWLKELRENQRHNNLPYTPEPLLPGSIDLPPGKSRSQIFISPKGHRLFDNMRLDGLESLLPILQKEIEKGDLFFKYNPRKPDFKTTGVRIITLRDTRWVDIVDTVDSVLESGLKEIDFTFRRVPQKTPPPPPLNHFELYLKIVDKKIQALNAERKEKRNKFVFTTPSFERQLAPCPDLQHVMSFGGPPPKEVDGVMVHAARLSSGDDPIIVHLRGCNCQVDASLVKSVL